MSIKRSEEVDDERLRQSKLEEALEIQSLRRIICAYLNYGDAAEEDVKRYEQSYRKLPPVHKALLSHYPQKFKRLRRCISANTFFIYNMLQTFQPPFDMSEDMDTHEHTQSEIANNQCPCSDVPNGGTCASGSEAWSSCTFHSSCVETNSSTLNNPNDASKAEVQEKDRDFGCNSRKIDKDAPGSEINSNGNGHPSTCDCSDPSLNYTVPLVDVDKVRCVVRNIVRDWAAEGQRERDQCYKPILEELDGLFAGRSKESPPSCLVPGAGLGRLALEISCLGFVSQGNEFSYYMMICSSFILNQAQEIGEWTLYPWIHSNCNSLSDKDQLRPVTVPDILPASAGITEGFSMCGGDFVEVYSDPSQAGAWDAVVTCFFLDTAHNIVEYVDIISKILKDGGVWINFGPLLYHFADMYGQDEMSIELSLEDLKKVALHYGFQIEKESTVETTYTTNIRSMMQNRYFAAFWTMRKMPKSN
uniref:carnosine N-methyltransferase n=1 Tax=Kalanchoe fedtschenkoi TaxID=63787 RepID=A0A7N0T328_KALFE